MKRRFLKEPHNVTFQKMTFFIPNPSSHIMALGFALYLMEISARRFFWGTAQKGGEVNAICEPIV
jgi:hypothetical protein